MFKPSTLRSLPRGLRVPRPSQRTFVSSRPLNGRPHERFDINSLSRNRNDYDRDRTYFLAAGAIAGFIGIAVMGTKLYQTIQAQNKKKGADGSSSSLQLDSAAPAEQFVTEAGAKRKVVIHDKDGQEVVPTGNKTVPEFPRLLELDPSTPPSDAASPHDPLTASIVDPSGVEYTLVGVGTRTVTIFGIHVYVVGYYIATADVAKLQKHLVKKVNPIATTLVPGERDDLRKALLDPKESEEEWTALLRDLRCRSAFRIIPVRNTDFHHLRDGFVRAITARSSLDKPAYGDYAFGEAMVQFRAIFNRGKIPSHKELIMSRDASGALEVLYGEEGKRKSLGRVEDERVSRLLWLNWLAGSNVASAEAQASIINGVMEFVERPVGTVAAQVV
jgi:chalcone isomerase-like protein